ncbi:hypothetical protein GLW20_00685 [Virgibacillus halodenitrificans]|nr:hypothetical protein [Virgibacillus halodenitrificans]
MKLNKVLYIVIVSALLAVVLTGCGMNVNAVNEEDAKAIITEQVIALKENIDRGREVLGDIDETHYKIISTEANLIASALQLEERMNSNDAQNVDNTIKIIERKLDLLSNTDAKEVENRMISTKLVYEEIFKDDLDSLINSLDVASIDNPLNSFVFKSGQDDYDFSEWEEDIDYAKNGITYIESTNANLQTALDKYGNNFSNEQKDLFYSIFGHSKLSSIEQSNILFALKNEEEYSDDTIEIAKTEFDHAYQAYVELEETLMD